eukprot:Colp12_sorted_trinity150504_noHs@10993
MKIQRVDGSEDEIERRYREFFSLHMDLMKAFPIEGGLKGAPRVLPFMPGKHFLNTDGREVAESRVEALQIYVDELLALDPKISRCPQVLQFFKKEPPEVERLTSFPNFDEAKPIRRVPSSSSLLQLGRVIEKPRRGFGMGSRSTSSLI